MSGDTTADQSSALLCGLWTTGQVSRIQLLYTCSSSDLNEEASSTTVHSFDPLQFSSGSALLAPTTPSR